MKKNEQIIKPQVVTSPYFIERVHEFEVEYGTNWGDFLAQFAKGKLPDDPYRAADYTEWAFLCRTFATELIAADSTGPPCHESFGDYEKPGHSPGFSFSFSFLNAKL